MTSSPDAAPDVPDLDPAVLAALADDLGDAEVVRDLVGTWLDELPGRRDVVARAVAAGDLSATTGQAHSLGSASALLGAARVAALSRALELRAADLDDAALHARVAEWDDACERAAAAYRSWLG